MAGFGRLHELGRWAALDSQLGEVIVLTESLTRVLLTNIEPRLI